MVDRLENIRAAFRILVDHVTTALYTQLGDANRLNATRAQALSLSVATEQVCFRHSPQMMYSREESFLDSIPMTYRQRNMESFRVASPVWWMILMKRAIDLPTHQMDHL
jgi:hypothetical protein